MICPLPRYYFCHAAVALLIAVTLWPLVGLSGGLTTGFAFYAGREFTQWESGLPFDWKGIAAPATACAIVFIISLFV